MTPAGEDPTSFDALAQEMGLGPRLRDLNRIFFRDGLGAGRGERSAGFEWLAAEHRLGQAQAQVARAFWDFGTRVGARQAAAQRRGSQEAPGRQVLRSALPGRPDAPGGPDSGRAVPPGGLPGGASSGRP